MWTASAHPPKLIISVRTTFIKKRVLIILANLSRLLFVALQIEAFLTEEVSLLADELGIRRALANDLNVLEETPESRNWKKEKTLTIHIIF